MPDTVPLLVVRRVECARHRPIASGKEGGV